MVNCELRLGRYGPRLLGPKEGYRHPPRFVDRFSRGTSTEEEGQKNERGPVCQESMRLVPAGVRRKGAVRPALPRVTVGPHPPRPPGGRLASVGRLSCLRDGECGGSGTPGRSTQDGTGPRWCRSSPKCPPVDWVTLSVDETSMMSSNPRTLSLEPEYIDFLDSLPVVRIDLGLQVCDRPRETGREVENRDGWRKTGVEVRQRKSFFHFIRGRQGLQILGVSSSEFFLFDRERGTQVSFRVSF